MNFTGGVGGHPANAGGAVNQGGLGNVGGLFGGVQKAQLGENKADNINPQAPDCYYYYYSTCTKVGPSLSLTHTGSCTYSLLHLTHYNITLFRLVFLTFMHSFTLQSREWL